MLLVEGWRWRDDREKQLLAYALTMLVNPHLKEPIPYDKIYQDLLSPDESARRKSVEHRKIIRERRRVNNERERVRTHGKRG